MPDIYVNKQSSVNSDQSKSDKPQTAGNKLLDHIHNPFTSYCYQPDSVRFETQDEGEKIILFLRKHPVTNIPWIVIAMILLFVPPFILPVFPILSLLPAQFQTVGIVAWYLVTTAFILENFFSWFFNVQIVTDERIVDIDFHNLIYREVSETKVDKIQDVTYKVGGVVRALFNYGDVYIQTAGTVPNFDFLSVPRPEQITRVLQELRTQEEQEALEGRVR
ncbi:PH domain-containing protein [Candidatus Microgenomates bacterium]|nr:PH domain-containing protein [Candidatus Microgenomates bacterium]